MKTKKPKTKTHRFMVRVVTTGNRTHAECAMLAAFAARSPDHCFFYLSRLPRKSITKTSPCSWHLNDDGAYDTHCGEIFELFEGTPAENKMRYCPFCGRTLRETK